ncbi:alpha/beta fold hydrolase [Arthrobacter sp. ZGTC131]|uniref:alpha/beta fold hydrolase n=1 Tax=Arthrobacter sp. ZGTC131 TaxID=2058898 RepID=UPI000CE35D3F|nr:alpha/beta fold hydrolase [Arthrobacter sp. ZGTC131]
MIHLDDGVPAVRTAGQLHYSYFPGSEGGSEPLVLLNSLGTSVEIWAPLLPGLTAATSVVCIDYPGHGWSSTINAPRELDALALQISGVLDTLQIERAHLAGVSIGGMLALRLAALRATRIRSIAVMGSAPTMDRALWTGRGELVKKSGTAAIVGELMPRWFTAAFRDANPAIIERYVGLLSQTDDAAYAALCTALAGIDIRPGLMKVRCPTLIVVGTEDPGATIDDAAEIATGIPQADIEIVEGAAHQLQAMAPTRITELVLEQLRRVAA